MLVGVVLAMLAALLPGLSAGTAQASTATSYERVTTMPVTGEYGPAVNRSTGELYTVDSSSETVYRYNRAGRLVSSWHVRRPTAVAVDRSGNVYVVEGGQSTDSDRLRKFSRTGAPLLTFDDANLLLAHAIAVAPSGQVYVANSARDQVVRFAASGAVLGTWGSEGTGAGQLDNPMGIAVAPNGTVYVSESENHRIQRFTADGRRLGGWGQRRRAPGQLWRPMGLDVDSAGRVYVADPGNFPASNRRVQIFTATGRFVASLGSPQQSVFSTVGPFDVAVDARGWLHVHDGGYSIADVKVFRPAQPAAKKARPKVPGKKMSVKGRVARVKVRCPKGSGACRGRVLVKHKKATLGKRTLAVKAGKVKVFKVRLTKKGRRVLNRQKPRRLTVVLNPGKGVKNVKKRLRIR